MPPMFLRWALDPTRFWNSFFAKVRDGLTEDSPYITSVKGPSVPTIRSLTGALHISFRSPFLWLTRNPSVLTRSNEWGQAPGFSASFTSLPPVCGGRILLDSTTLDLDSPRLEGPTRSNHSACNISMIHQNLITILSCLLHRRGYLSCKWELLGKPRHFVTIHFDRFDLGHTWVSTL